LLAAAEVLLLLVSAVLLVVGLAVGVPAGLFALLALVAIPTTLLERARQRSRSVTETRRRKPVE
jgi:type III secretory pathway component EscV